MDLRKCWVCMGPRHSLAVILWKQFGNSWALYFSSFFFTSSYLLLSAFSPWIDEDQQILSIFEAFSYFFLWLIPFQINQTRVKLDNFSLHHGLIRVIEHLKGQIAYSRLPLSTKNVWMRCSSKFHKSHFIYVNLERIDRSCAIVW